MQGALPVSTLPSSCRVFLEANEGCWEEQNSMEPNKFIDGHLYVGLECHIYDSEEEHVSFVSFNSDGLRNKLCDPDFISL